MVDQTRSVVDDVLIYAIDTANHCDSQLVPDVAALSNSKKGTLITLLPTQVEMPSGEQVAGAALGSKAAGYERRQAYVSGFQHSDSSAGCWKRLVDRVKLGLARPVVYEVIGGAWMQMRLMLLSIDIQMARLDLSLSFILKNSERYRVQ